MRRQSVLCSCLLEVSRCYERKGTVVEAVQTYDRSLTMWYRGEGRPTRPGLGSESCRSSDGRDSVGRCA